MSPSGESASETNIFALGWKTPLWRVRMKHGFEIPEAWFVSFVPGEYRKSWPACR